MFLSRQTSKQQEKYIKNLQLMGSLSLLYSESKTPYLYYRIAEILFCKAFNADNLSRSDLALDAKKDFVGIGLKTFLAQQNKTFQKIAEFNRDSPSYKDLSCESLIKKIAKLRNTRLQTAKDIHNIKKSIYHCILREEGCFKIFESEMKPIEIDKIKKIKKGKNGTTICFNDGINDYTFSLSKSTLSQRFITSEIVKEFDVNILKDPLSALQKCFLQNQETLDSYKIQSTIYLPLYGNSNGKKLVYPKSGLNQWNAKGRERNNNEVYIPIPIIIHKSCTNFFPTQDSSFELILPNGQVLNAKVCQDNSKALMSCPNKELGKWLLRDVLKMPKSELLTYEILQDLNIDSVRIDKINNNRFEINFSKINSYENFLENIQ